MEMKHPGMEHHAGRDQITAKIGAVLRSSNSQDNRLDKDLRPSSNPAWIRPRPLSQRHCIQRGRRTSEKLELNRRHPKDWGKHDVSGSGSIGSEVLNQRWVVVRFPLSIIMVVLLPCPMAVI